MIIRYNMQPRATAMLAVNIDRAGGPYYPIDHQVDLGSSA